MNRKGFSLLEVLVSCAILLILFIFLAQSLQVSGTIWTGGRSRSETRRVIRAAQDLMRSDLQAVALPLDREMVATRGNLQMVINPASVSDAFRNADVIFWQAPIATEQSEGVFAEVGYFVRWRHARATLCRLFLNPAESRTLLGGADLYQRVYQHPGNWVNDDVLDAAAPADRANGYLGLFAENVIAFWVRPLNDQGAVIYNVGTDGFDSNVSFGGKPAPVLPDGVEISLIVIDPSAANILASRGDAEAIIAQLQLMATQAKGATDQSPAAYFMAQLKNADHLHFLYKGASPHQMLVNLK